jgi:hypothetical protein
MKVSRPKRVSAADAGSPEAREALNTVGSSSNTFMNEVYIAIMGNLSVSDNLDMTFLTFSVNVDASGNLNRAVRLKSGLKGRSNGMICIRVSQAVPTASPWLTYTESSGIIEITNVKGLAADTEYTLVALLIGN